MLQDPGKTVPGSPPKAEQPPVKDAPGKTAIPGQTTAATKVEPTSPDAAKPGQTLPTATAPADLPPQPVNPLQSPPVATTTGVAVAAPAPFTIGSILIPALWLVGVLVAAALILAWLKRSRQQSDLVTATPTDQLSTFRHAYEEGEMTPEEYKKVKARLTEKLRERDPMSMPPQVRRHREEDPLTEPGDTTP